MHGTSDILMVRREGLGPYGELLFPDTDLVQVTLPEPQFSSCKVRIHGQAKREMHRSQLSQNLVCCMLLVSSIVIGSSRSSGI